MYVYDRTRCERVLAVRPTTHTHTHYTSLTFYTLSQIHAHSDDVSALNVEGESSHMIYSGGDDGLCKVHNTQSMYYYNNAYTTCILYDMFT